jgi:short chain dehydrogenase
MSTTALITGGTSGIGRAVANKLAQLGIHALVVGRNEERGEKTIAEIRAAGGQADFISSDLRDASSARQVARRAIELGNGHVDILINNAGVYPFASTHETSEELFDKVYSLNVKVPYFLVAELAPLMAKRGRGAIVNLSTMVAERQIALVSSRARNSPSMEAELPSNWLIQPTNFAFVIKSRIAKVLGRDVRIGCLSALTKRASVLNAHRSVANRERRTCRFGVGFANTPAHKSRPTPIEFLTSSSFRCIGRYGVAK